MGKDVLVVATLASFVSCFEMNDISILQDMGYTVHIAANFDDNRGKDYFKFFSEHNVVTHNINFQRSPFKPSNFKLIKQLRNIIESGNFDLVHCHTPVGGVIARLAAKKYRKNGLKVVYTAHGYHFFKGGPTLNWLIFYPIEKLLSHCSDAIITINNEDYQITKNKFYSEHSYKIPGVGRDCAKFDSVDVNRNEYRKSLGIDENDIMILSVGELSPRKNHQVIINAVKKIGQSNLHYFIAGDGALKAQLEDLAKSLNIENQVHLLGFRTDIACLLKSADIFAFPSRQEGFGIALLEAMACGLPCVTTSTRGINELILNKEMLNNSDDVSGYASSILRLMNDRQYSQNEGKANKKHSAEFDISNTQAIMKRIYKEVLAV